MIRRTLVLLVLLVTFGAFAATPTIDLFPSSGVPGGGEFVQIRLGNGQTFACTVIATCLPSATFDNIPAQLIDSGPNLIVVKTPPHARGEVKVSVFTGSTTLTTSFHYLVEDDWERILVPASFSGELSGVAGSRWTSDFRVGNRGTEPFDVRSPACNLLISPTPLYIHLAAGQGTIRTTPLSCGSFNFPAAFIYVPKWALPQFYANARVQDVSRQSETWGTEQPVVRVTDFQRGVVLTNIPNDDKFRTTLRIYGPDSSPMPVRIRIFRLESGDSPIVDTTMQLAGIISVLPISFPTEPAYLQLALESFAGIAGQGPLRIEVEAPEQATLWAFASVTNNATQHVTLVTPQPFDPR